MRIEDGKGRGYFAEVDENHHVLVKAFTASAQSRASQEDGSAYQVLSGAVDIATSAQEILLLKNTSETKNVIITYIRVETIGAAAATETAFLTVNLGGVYTSGGDAVTPVNVNTGSSSVADVVAYSGTTAIVASGYSEIDRYYEANNQITYNKEGAVVLDTNGVLSINHIGSDTNGAIHARISFYMTEKES
jgi:hypothetical protein